MDKKKPKDNLENLFGKMFNDTEEVGQDTGWDMPPAEVWDNIQMGLQEEKEPKRIVGYWWWLSAAASFLLLISVFQLYQYKKIQELSHQLVLKEKAIIANQSDLEELIYQKEQKEKLIIEKNHVNADTRLSEEKEGVPPIRRTPFLKELSANIAAIEKANISNPVNDSSPKKSAFNANSSTTIDGIAARNQANNLIDVEIKELANKPKDLQKQELAINIPNKIAAERNIGNVSLSKLPTLFNLLKINDKAIPSTINSIVPIIKNKPSFYVAVDYAPYWEEKIIKGGRFGEVIPFFVSESQKKSYSTGLQFGVKLGKGWIVETGFRYLNSKVSAQHTGKIPYPRLEERLSNQGTYESTLNLQLNSSSEVVETEVVFSRSSSTSVEANTILNLNLAYSKSVAALDIPLLVKKQWTIGKLGVNIKAGLLNRFIINDNLEHLDITVDDARFQSRLEPNEERNSRNKLSTYSPNFLAGFGIDYQIQSKLSVYAEPTFVRSIGPIRKIGLSDIFAEGKMVNFGIRYQL